MNLVEPQERPEDHVMKLGVPTKFHRKVGMTNRFAIGLAVVTLTCSLSFIALSHPEAVSTRQQNQSVREIIPDDYVSTCHRRHEDGSRALLPEKYLTINDCKKRLPDVVVLGTKKCGTGALRVFLDTHPSVVFSKKAEAKFFTQNYKKGLDWYVQIMRPTANGQVGMEKSPGYFFSSEAARRIKSDLPESTKFIVILCNPVRRTISEFTFEQLNKIKDKFQVDTDEAKVIAKRTFNSSKFEKYITTSSGRIRTNVDIITHSMYDKYILSWLKLFSRSRFLFVDGDNFTHNPVTVLNEIEQFIDVPRYFNSSRFYFDKEKGFFCLSEPFKQCLRSTKGLEHPPVDRTVLRKLRELFKAHDFATSILTLKNFTWMKNDYGTKVQP
ncbi:heparan sulfate glucosamine 3-O-sulfotransferase 3A1-like [Lytechinus pictus]|uniref:heparan sulfate glucosamine 3-O-sulfotransferase 3A1-like n=1 Tax=Lytechinus pictus TaxID=7653 RepID=UPI0030BA2375